jgi:hypothetical protein
MDQKKLESQMEIFASHLREIDDKYIYLQKENNQLKEESNS